MILLIFWIVVLLFIIWQLTRPVVTDTSTVAPDATTGRQLLNDVGSGTTLQGSDLPLGVSSPQETAKP